MKFGQNPSFGSRYREGADKLFLVKIWKFQGAGVTLKMRSRSPKFTHFPPPKNVSVQVWWKKKQKKKNIGSGDRVQEAMLTLTGSAPKAIYEFEEMKWCDTHIKLNELQCCLNKGHHTYCPCNNTDTDNMSLVLREPVFARCEQQSRRSACASAQSKQRLCCSLPG